MESTSEILTIENLLPDELTALEPVSNNDRQQQFNWPANNQSNRQPATQPPAADGTLQSGIEATRMQTVYPQAQSSFNPSVVNQRLPVPLHSSTTSFPTFNESNPMNLINRPVQLPNSSLHQFNNFQTYNNRVRTLNPCRYAVPAVNQCTYTVPISDDRPSCSQTQVKPVQQLEDWQLSISEENRNENVNCLIEAIFSDGCAESMLDDRLNHLLNYAKKAENEIYHSADSEVDYHQLLVDKIISSRIEMEERRRKREILANQRRMILNRSYTNLPSASIRIPTIAGVADVSGNLQPAPLNRNQSINTPLGPPGLDQAAQTIQVAPTQAVKEWHKRLTLDLRKHFIVNMIKKLWMHINGTFLDYGIQHLSRYAIKVERDIFDSANSRSEYMQLLADKTYLLEKELDEKIRRRQEREELASTSQQALQQPVVSNLGPGIPGPSRLPQGPVPRFQNFPMMPGPYQVMPRQPR